MKVLIFGRTHQVSRYWARTAGLDRKQYVYGTVNNLHGWQGQIRLLPGWRNGFGPDQVDTIQTYIATHPELKHYGQ